MTFIFILIFFSADLFKLILFTLPRPDSFDDAIHFFFLKFIIRMRSKASFMLAAGLFIIDLTVILLVTAPNYSTSIPIFNLSQRLYYPTYSLPYAYNFTL